MSRQRYIAHLDLDCFYVSVERIKNPSLNGKPVAVGGSATGRGVIASASYEARAYGVRSAMPAGRALKLCPQLILVSGHYSEYEDYSDKVFERMKQFSPVVERASIDEMYMDFTGCEHLYGNDLPGLMRTLHETVLDDFTLPCTIALSANKLVSKVAAGTAKPNGVIHVPHGEEQTFLAPLDIEAIPGIGKKTSEFLRKKGFRLVADIQKIPLREAIKLLGKHGVWIHNASNGRGTDILTPETVRKSISNEETFGHDIGEIAELEKRVFPLVESVCASARSHQWKARTITLKLRYSDFKTITRAESLHPTNDDAVVSRKVAELLKKNFTRKMGVRLLGVKLSHFNEEVEAEMPLFAQDKREPALEAVDKIRGKFGEDVIHVGGV